MNKNEAAKLADDIGKLRVQKAETEESIKEKQALLLEYFKVRGISAIAGDHYNAKQTDSKNTAWNALAITAVAAEAKVPIEALKTVTPFTFVRTDAIKKS